MKEIIVTILTLFGVDMVHEAPVEEKKIEVVEEVSHHVPAAETKESSQVVTHKEEKPEEKEATEGYVQDSAGVIYDVPEDAPWWNVVNGSQTISETSQKGENGQVTTIWGNGSQGQDELRMTNPRQIQIDSKGNIYFVDGSSRSAKLRMFDGKKNHTVVDLIKNKVTDNDGYFLSTGLAVIHNNVYISNEKTIFSVKDGRIRILDERIGEFMKTKRMNEIYHLEVYNDSLYIMMVGKSRYHTIVRYNPETRELTEILEPHPYPTIRNFYVNGDNEILLLTTMGQIIAEQMFPRQGKIYYTDGDPMVQIADAWIGENDVMYFATWEDQIGAYIYEDPKGPDNKSILAGGRRGFVDGFHNEVEMDYPLDFVWDGSGYIFADVGNHAIRKLWLDVAPMH